MRKLFPLLFLAVAPVLGGGFLGIGESSPELSKGHWAGSAPVKLAEYKGKKMVALLFWAPESSGARAIQHFAGTAYRLRKMPVAFVSVGKGSADQVMKFPLFRQFGGIPVLADPDGRNQELFLRSENRLPQALLIGKDGKLLWRGAPGRLAAVISAVEKNKYDQKRVRYEDDFSAAFSGFVAKNDFKGALAYLDKALADPLADPLEIVALQVGIHYRRLNSVDGALAAVHKAQERFPGQAPYYEMELKLLELGHREDLMEEFYLRLTGIFRKQPRVLLNFVRHEMNRPVEQMIPRNVYIVARAAANAEQFPNDREKGRALIFYAQSLYCLGRVDLALPVAERAVKLLQGTSEFQQAQGVAGFYRKLVEFLPRIKE